jgi:hypothetical protein
MPNGIGKLLCFHIQTSAWKKIKRQNASSETHAKNTILIHFLLF